MENPNFDISALSYEEFIGYFFTARAGVNREPYWHRETSRPDVVVQYLTRCCTEFRQLVERVSLQDLDEGLDEMLSLGSFELQAALWDSRVPLQERIDCIRSMYRVFADFVANRELGTSEGCFYMWWDFVCWGFWFDQTYHKKLATENYELLCEEDRKIVDAMFETLVEILKLEGDCAKVAALHGLGHVHHPGVRAVVQEFIDRRASEFDAKAISWLEKCRDGRVM